MLATVQLAVLIVVKEDGPVFQQCFAGIDDAVTIGIIPDRTADFADWGQPEALGLKHVDIRCGRQVGEATRHEVHIHCSIHKVTAKAVAVACAADQGRSPAAECRGADPTAAERKFVAVDGSCVNTITAVGKGDFDVSLRVEHCRGNRITISRAGEVGRWWCCVWCAS